MKVLDLFSGIGGFSLGLEMAGGFETVAFCEQDKYCQRVLAKHWPDVPCHDDIRELRGDAIGPVDIITGGTPCQPFSSAGQRRGAEDDRHLWPEMHRLVAELRPAWVLGENVAGLISMGLDDVLSDLEAEGYACRAFVIPAVAVDARHRRDRVWIVANFVGEGLSNIEGCETPAEFSRIRVALGPNCDAGNNIRWGPQPTVDRVANGIPNRMDRLRTLGNAVVPQVVAEIGRAIYEAHHD